MDNYIITKFAAVVPYACMCIYTHFGRKTTTFSEVTSNPLNSHTTQEHTCTCTCMTRNTCKIIGQQRVMFNKIVKLNRIITKFATIVQYTVMIMGTHFGQKRTTSAEVTLKI